MKSKIILAILVTISFFSCQTEQDKLNTEVMLFNTFSDSLLAVNKNYVEVLYGDTDVFVISDPLNSEINFKDTAIQLHSNIFDTTSTYTQTKMVETLMKYNSWEQNLDLLKPKMDAQTASLFERIKAQMNTIKQPVQ